MSENRIDLYNLGYYHYTGTNGYPLNQKKAFDFFSRSAELGLSEAMNYLGVMYQRGENVMQNYKTAADWYSKAIQADNGNALAAHNLGCLHYFGNGVPQNMDKAFELFQTSINLGRNKRHVRYANSCYMAGLIMMNHLKNNRGSIPYFKEAANCGNIPEAWHNLGYLCEQGAMDVSKADIPSVAFRYYQTAADLDFAPSMLCVANIFAQMNMMDEARYWTNRAAEKGYEPAKKAQRFVNASSIWDLFK